MSSFKQFYNQVVYCAFCGFRKEFSHEYETFDEELENTGWEIVNHNIACPYCAAKHNYDGYTWSVVYDGKKWFPYQALVKNTNIVKK